MAEAVSISLQKNFGIGDSLSANMDRRACPFSVESLKMFVKSFQVLQTNRNKVDRVQTPQRQGDKKGVSIDEEAHSDDQDDDDDAADAEEENHPHELKEESLDSEAVNTDLKEGSMTAGTFTFTVRFVKSNEDLTKALDAGGSLSLTYGPVSGDADVQFGKKHTMSDLSVSLVVTGRQEGQTVKCNLVDINNLQLAPYVKTQIEQKSDMMSMAKFKEKYGAYFIIGFEYGGNINFISKTTVHSDADKTTVEGNIKLGLKEAGLDVGGSASVKVNNNDVHHAMETTTDFSIYPSVDSELVNSDTGIIALLSALGNPNLPIPDALKHQNTQSLLARKSEELFSSTSKRVRAIVISMDTIRCVDEAFSKVEMERQNLNTFFAYANPMYFALCSMTETLKSMRENLLKYDAEYKEMKPVLTEWKKKVNAMRLFYENIGCSLTSLHEAAKVYTDKALGYDFDEDDVDDPDAIVNAKHRTMMLTYIGKDRDDIMDEFQEKVIMPYNRAMDQIAADQIAADKLQADNQKDVTTDIVMFFPIENPRRWVPVIGNGVRFQVQIGKSASIILGSEKKNEGDRVKIYLNDAGISILIHKSGTNDFQVLQDMPYISPLKGNAFGSYCISWSAPPKDVNDSWKISITAANGQRFELSFGRCLIPDVWMTVEQ